jgi:hypothetical protein
MAHAELHRRLQKLEQPHQSIRITEVLLYGQDEPEPEREPGVQVIQIKLDDPCEQGEAAGR